MGERERGNSQGAHPSVCIPVVLPTCSFPEKMQQSFVKSTSRQWPHTIEESLLMPGGSCICFPWGTE